MTIRRSPLNAARDAVRYMPRPRSKKSKPQGFSREVREIVTARSGGICEIGDCPAYAVHMHHRRPRGLGGTSVPWVNKAANALHLCRQHHEFIESHRILAYVEGWLISQNGDVMAAEVPVLRRGRSVLLADDGSVQSIEGGVA